MELDSVKCGYLCFISDVSDLLKGICRLFIYHGNGFDKTFIANELVLTEAMLNQFYLTFIEHLLLLIVVSYLPDLIFYQHPFLTKLRFN